MRLLYGAALHEYVLLQTAAELYGDDHRLEGPRGFHLPGRSVRPGVSRPQRIDSFNWQLVLSTGRAVGNLQSCEIEGAFKHCIVRTETIEILTACVGVSSGNVPAFPENKKSEIELATTLREGNLVAGSIHRATTFTPCIG
ncbi:MAG: hypothetical protein DMG97_15775 [Acidobacteria bacterium]|nr:MAG: hypothetical protein DMG97_15775 [Acidobacteriota bacterium]PYV76286.1 MAG: hypothetical protein DMG96_14620 [Acidobacteriota bacterium]